MMSTATLDVHFDKKGHFPDRRIEEKGGGHVHDGIFCSYN